MVAPIDPSQGLARLAALLRASGGQAGRAGGGSPDVATPAGAQAAAITLRQQLLAVALDHPRRRRALARVLIESMLGAEFGARTVHDPGFQAVVDDVLDALQGHAKTAADLDRVVDSLMAGA
jgi:hypothetical protein